MSTIKQVIAINESDRSDVTPVRSETVRPARRRLPDERRAITHHFSIVGARSASRRAMHEIQSHAVRTQRLVWESEDRLCHVAGGLPVPLVGTQVHYW